MCCKDCQSRCVGCHDKCTSYQSYKADLAKVRAAKDADVYRAYACMKASKVVARKAVAKKENKISGREWRK